MRVLRSYRPYVTTADGLWQPPQYAPGRRPPNQNQRPAGPALRCPDCAVQRCAVLTARSWRWPARGWAVPRTSTGGGVLEILDQPARLPGIDRDARTHGRGQRDLPDVTALGCGRLEPEHLLECGRVVLHQGRLRERRLADHEMQVPVPVHPELDLATLDVGDSLADVGGDSA